MKVHARGFWGIFHWILNCIGRGLLWPFPARKSPRDEEVYTMAGGAVLGLPYGLVFGVQCFAQTHTSHPFAGAIFGGLLGVCMGIVFGAVVDVVDEYIEARIHSVDTR